MSATSPAPPSPPRQNPSTFPPRRGRIKAQIFGDMGRSLLAAASNLLRREGGGPATPPPAAKIHSQMPGFVQVLPGSGFEPGLRAHSLPLDSDVDLFEPQLLFRAVVQNM